jgi:REP element-mobilizing transposase RayT
MATVLKNLGCAPILINSVEDHVHLLFDLARTVTVAKVVEEVKKSSSKWLKTQAPELQTFSWQAGYGAFAVSISNVGAVRHYIATQQEHHCKRSFQDEFREMLRLNGIECDERYVWD